MAKSQDQLATSTLTAWLRFERAQFSADSAYQKFAEAREAMGADAWGAWCKAHNLANGSAEETRSEMPTVEMAQATTTAKPSPQGVKPAREKTVPAETI
jgi:hypothetical protein